MADSPAWSIQHATELRNHWWWRPGWRAGRRFYTWHYTFGGEYDLHELVAVYQRALKQFSNLDLIPAKWLHLTVQGLGFVEDFDADEVNFVQQAVDAQMQQMGRIDVTFRNLVVRPEAIALPPEPIEPLRVARNAIRRGIAETLGPDKVSELGDEFQPHVSVAYVNRASDPAPVIAALDSIKPEPVKVALAGPRLIELRRDNRMYEW